MDEPTDADVPAPPGLLLVAHGSRVDAHAAEVEELTAAVAARVDAEVAYAFVELMEPDGVLAGERLLVAGRTSVVVAPLLLFSAYHARQDVPAVAGELAARHPGVRFSVAESLGPDPRLLALAARRAGRAEGPGHALLVVSSGSSDEGAQVQAAAVAREVAALTGHDRAAHAFASVAQPDTTAALRGLIDTGVDAITVVSWSLFDGRLVRGAEAEVERIAGSAPIAIRWRGRLWPDPVVAEVVVDRYRAALEARV